MSPDVPFFVSFVFFVVKSPVVSEVVTLTKVVLDVERGLDMEGVHSEKERSRLWLMLRISLQLLPQLPAGRVCKPISLELLRNSRLMGETCRGAGWSGLPDVAPSVIEERSREPREEASRPKGGREREKE